MPPHLLVCGAGSLAGELVRSLVAHVPRAEETMLRITIASRDLERARWIGAVARAHSLALGRDVAVGAVPNQWRNPRETAELIDAAEPDLVLHAASLQSAWSLTESNRWSRFVRTCGYGVTTPLQLVLARHLQDAIARSRCRPRWINACFPDLVNQCLAAEGAAPLCGVGNVAIIAEHVRLQLALPAAAPLRVVAGHVHIVPLQRPRTADEPLPAVWIGAERLGSDQLARLEPLPEGSRLNAFNAAEAARLLWAILTGSRIRTHAPGPDALPGGYPVIFDRNRMALDLPKGVEAVWAVAFNEQAMVGDGAFLDGGTVRFAPAAAAALRQEGSFLADGFAVRDVAEAARALTALRQAWGTQP